ncbi:hypothetical protein BJX99DRAFT_221049 [Aspergillus californicus]
MPGTSPRSASSAMAMGFRAILSGRRSLRFVDRNTLLTLGILFYLLNPLYLFEHQVLLEGYFICYHGFKTNNSFPRGGGRAR